MSYATIIYLIDTLDSLKVLLIVLMLIFMGIGVVCIPIIKDPESNYIDDYVYEVKRAFNSATLLGFILASFIAFIPSEKTMYMMLAAKVCETSEMPLKIKKIIDHKLDEILDKFEKKKES